MSPKDISESLKNGIAKKPHIIRDNNNSYVIIGSTGHGYQIPSDSIKVLIDSLEDVVALKLEGDEETLKILHPMSTEILTKVAVGSVPVSFFPEADEEDIGQKLLNYGVSEEIAEIFIPCMHIRMNESIIDRIFGMLPIVFEEYKQRFSFINTPRAIENFLKVCNYWADNDLNPFGLDHFSYDFEKFMGDVREYEFWKPDLIKFRSQFNGKIAVCTGDYHTTFIQTILDGKEVQKPDWYNHIDKRREDVHTPQNPIKLKQIYQNLEMALEA